MARAGKVILPAAGKNAGPKKGARESADPYRLIAGSERQRMEEALRVSEERYRSLFDTMTEGFALHEIVCDKRGVPIDYRFLEINPAFERLTGLKRADVIGKLQNEVLPDDDPEWVKRYGQVALTGKPVHFEKYSSVLRRHYSVHAYRPAPRQFAVIFSDITRHKQAEAELRISLAKYRTLIDSFPLGITIADANGNIIETNKEASRLLGLPKRKHEKRTIGDKAWRIIRPDGTPMPAEEFASVRAIKEKALVANIETGIVKGAGEVTWLNVTAAPIPLAGYSVAITYGDISERKRMEKALQESTNYLEKLLNYANAPIIVWDPSFRIIRFNRAFERLTGHAAAQVHGKPLDMLFPDASRSESLKLIRDTLQGRHWEIVEIPILQKSGSVRTVLWNSANIHDKAGAVIATIAQGQDITERKQMEDALRRSESILHSFFNSPGIRRGIIDVIDETEIRHIASNLETARYYGLTPEAMQNKTSTELGESPETVRLWLQHCRKSRFRRQPVSFEFPLMRGEQEVWQSVVITYLSRISRGQHRFSHVTIDISERKRMEKALQESTNYLEKLLNYANAPIIVWDPSFRIIRFNRAFERLTGHAAAQVHGKPLDMLFPDASRSESLKLIRDTLQGRHWEIVEIPILQKSGSIRTVLWNSANIHDKGGAVIATIAQGQDITERKQTEEQVAASLHEKEMLLRELYHRTKNNMNVISSLVMLQGATVRDPAVLRMFSDMQSRIRAMSLVHEKLYQSSDLFNLDIREYINELAGTILAGYKNSVTRISLNLDIESVPFSIDSALPCGLVINELMTNSLKYAFTDERTGEIGISLRLSPGGEVTLRYHDNGIGFPEGFDPAKASSLGLKLINNLVRKQLLGRLEFIAAPGVRVVIRFQKTPIERPERE